MKHRAKFILTPVAVLIWLGGWFVWGLHWDPKANPFPAILAVLVGILAAGILWLIATELLPALLDEWDLAVYRDEHDAEKRKQAYRLQAKSHVDLLIRENILTEDQRIEAMEVYERS